MQHIVTWSGIEPVTLNANCRNYLEGRPRLERGISVFAALRITSFPTGPNLMDSRRLEIQLLSKILSTRGGWRFPSGKIRRPVCLVASAGCDPDLTPYEGVVLPPHPRGHQIFSFYTIVKLILVVRISYII